MHMMLADYWWIWIAAGLVLAILEVLVPGFLFAGYAVGAVVTGALIGTGIMGEFGGSLSLTLLIFAVVSVVENAGNGAIDWIRNAFDT